MLKKSPFNAWNEVQYFIEKVKFQQKNYLSLNESLLILRFLCPVDTNESKQQVTKFIPKVIKGTEHRLTKASVNESERIFFLPAV